MRVKRTLLTIVTGAIVVMVVLGTGVATTSGDTTSTTTRATTAKSRFIKQMTAHAWHGYYAHARMSDELKPLTRSPHFWYSQKGLLSTAVDSLDTLFLMQLHAQYKQAKQLVLSSLDLSIDRDINIFETTIRILGGLLSIHALDPDPRYLALATNLANKLIPAFNSPSSLPVNAINLFSNYTPSPSIACLAEVGTLQLEFQYLSDITGNPIYSNTALAVFEALFNQQLQIPGLYPQNIDLRSLHLFGTLGIAGCADSFYEYILKLYVSTKDPRYLAKFHESAAAIHSHLVVYPKSGKGAYLVEIDSIFSPKSDLFHHLSCFAGGMYALGSNVDPSHPNATSYMALAADLTHTCYASYNNSKTGLGGEVVDGEFATPFELSYYLRPEVVESIFYMWRYTHNEMYREWGWKIVLAIEKHCRNNVGYHGIHNGNPHDKQDSFFLAETLKYLYLLFSDDNVMPLNKYVFNTEAHAFPIRGHGLRSDPSKFVPLLANSK